jgi:hypothetical protein
MNNLSFDIKTSKNFYEKLLIDHDEFSKDKTSSRNALNCAMTAWHLTEWVYNEFNQILNSQFSSLSLFQQDLKHKCPALQIMHDLANGTKHYHLTKHRPIVSKTNLHAGSFDSSFDRSFDISTLEIELKDGSKIYFEDEIETAIIFWKHYFQSTFNLLV